MKRTNSDFPDWAPDGVFLLIRAFGLAHPLFVDGGVFGVGTALLWCLGLHEGGSQCELFNNRGEVGEPEREKVDKAEA